MAEEKQVNTESKDMIIIITDSVSKRISSETVFSGGIKLITSIRNAFYCSVATILLLVLLASSLNSGRCR